MTKKKPRYDLPNAAPEPVRLVQRFVNTIDLSHDREWLTGFLADEGLVDPSEAELDEAASAAAITVDFGTRTLVSTAGGLDGILGRVAVTALGAMADGTWERLKCCRNVACRWSFYDYSRNRSASWCSMQICGNRTKTRAYRRRAAR